MKLASGKISINHARQSSRYTLMHQDIPLIDINEEDDTFHIHEANRQFLPYALRRPNLAFPHFYTWAGNRSIFLDRKNAKALLNACCLPQDDKFEIVKSCKLLSVEDCFWIKESGEECWDNMNLHNNAFSDAIAKTALNNDRIAITGDINTPEFTTKGTFPKAWIREADGLYLYKKSLNDFESEKEGLASDILDAINIPHVKYEMTGTGVCRCKCMTDKNNSRLTFGEYRTFCRNNNIDPLELFETAFSKSFCQMVIADYILANTDRHPDNWGLFMDNKTGDIQSMHPLFDHNLAFDPKFHDNMPYPPAPGYTYYELAVEAMKEIRLDLSGIQDIPEERFEEVGMDYKTVITRVEKMDGFR